MRRLRDSISGLLDLVLPLRCAGCGLAGTGWCRDCGREIGVPRRIERPLLVPGPPAYSLGRYRGAARRAVLAYKESGRRDLAEPFGRAFAAGLCAIDGTADPWELIPAPSRPAASRRRGGAHLVRVGGRVVSALADLDVSGTVADCLALGPGVRDSAQLEPAERVRNLNGRVLLRPGHRQSRNGRTVLFDDVITTGATATCCLEVLENAGIQVDYVLGLTATAG